MAAPLLRTSLNIPKARKEQSLRAFLFPSGGKMSNVKMAYSIEEAIKAASIGRSLIYSEIKNGNLRATKIGRRTVILADDLKQWLQSKTQAKAA